MASMYTANPAKKAIRNRTTIMGSLWFQYGAAMASNFIPLKS